MLLETAVSTLIGLLGTGLTTYSDYKLKQQDVDSRIRLMDAKTRNASKEEQPTLEEPQEDTASYPPYKPALPSMWLETLLHQKGWGRIVAYPAAVVLLLIMGLGDVLNHLMRPALTLYSFGIASWVTYKCWALLPPNVEIAIIWKQWEEVTSVVMLLAVTLITWWFGDRRIVKHLMHMRSK